MGLLDFFKKINMATGGVDPNQAMFAGLASLGLTVQNQQGMAVTELAGAFDGRHAAMVVDGSAIMGASRASYGQAAGTAVAGALGLISPRQQEWSTQMNYFRARNRMQSAQMQLRWAVIARAPIWQPLNIGRDPSYGNPIGPGLFAGGEPNAISIVAQPHVSHPLSMAPFDEIAIHDGVLTAFWAPPMSEYQQVARSPDQFTAANRNVFVALSAAAAALGG